MKTLHSFLIAVLLTMLINAPAWATVYYVSTTGSDSNTCTAAQSITTPKRTIASVNACVTAGDTMYLRGGIYAEAVYCGINSCLKSGTSWDVPVTLASYPGETAILKPTSGLRVVNFQDTGGAQAYIILDRLVLDGANVTNDCMQIQNGANHIRVQNSDIKNCPGNGINIAPNSDSHEILGNTIHDSGNTNLEHGVYVSSSNNIIAWNTIYRSSGYGVHVYAAAGGANQNKIYSNRVYENGTVTPSLAAGILLSSGTGNIASNNVLYRNPYGLKIGSGGGTTLASIVAHNTCFDNNVPDGKTGIIIMSDSAGAIVSGNTSYGNRTAIIDNGTNTTILY